MNTLPHKLTEELRDAFPPPISKSCFAAMQSETSLVLTTPYHAEELAALEKLLAETEAAGKPVDHFIAIGCAQFRYADVAFQKCKSYTAVEPGLEDNKDIALLKSKSATSKIHIVTKPFEDVTKEDLPQGGRKLFFFLFNVFPYIDDAQKTLKELAAPGDIAVVSAWNNNSFEALHLQKVYYGYLQSAFNCELSGEKRSGYIDLLAQSEREDGAEVSRTKGRMTDILTLQMK